MQKVVLDACLDYMCVDFEENGSESEGLGCVCV